MSAQILDGKVVSEAMLDRVTAAVKQAGKPMKLVVILVGEDPASAVYVRNKGRACERTGIGSEILRLPATTTREELLAVIHRLNEDKTVSGILCQLPLPKHIPETDVLLAIRPEKDVDCFHPENTGRLFEGHPHVLPCTPAGVMTILSHYGIPVAGKKCVVVGRSNIVGKPMAMLLLAAHGTVTICHSKTVDLAAVCRDAEILVAAIGKPNFITRDMVRPGAVVVDVGVNRIPDPSKPSGSRLTGDVDYGPVSEVASWITPVPGGVGLMTIATLMENVVRLSTRPA